MIEHLCLPLKLSKSASGWRGPCPLCAAGRVVEVSIKGGRIVWNNHCRCSRDKVGAALADLAACFPGQPASRVRRKDVVPRAELDKLIGLPGAALELRVACLAWDCPPAEAAAKLGMPPRTLRWALSRVPR